MKEIYVHISSSDLLSFHGLIFTMTQKSPHRASTRLKPVPEQNMQQNTMIFNGKQC